MFAVFQIKLILALLEIIIPNVNKLVDPNTCPSSTAYRFIHIATVNEVLVTSIPSVKRFEAPSNNADPFEKEVRPFVKIIVPLCLKIIDINVIIN